MPHHNPWLRYETRHGIEPETFGLVDECSTTDLTLLLDLEVCLGKPLKLGICQQFSLGEIVPT